MKTQKAKRPGELARDTKRSGGPRFGGESWSAAEEREDDERFGKARNEAPPDPLRDSPNIAGELPRDIGVSGDEPDEDENAADEDVRVESGGQHAGIGRGEKPRKPKARTKPNPRAAKKTSKRKAKKR
jgi:hypothetical protein